jgi:hypothetical protein
MSKVFATKQERSLAGAGEMGRRLGMLQIQEPSAALEGASAWLDSLVAAEELKPERCLEVILQIDEAVLPQTRRLSREFLTTPQLPRSTEYRLWKTSHGYWHRLATSYEHCLSRLSGTGKSKTGVAWARLLHACGNWLKWAHFRYGPVPGELWSRAGAAYLAAERGKIAGQPVTLYAGYRDTTPAAEYLGVLLLKASSMDNLLPVEIEIAERLIAHLLPNFSLTDQARPDNVYWVDTDRPLPPTRLARLPEITATLRFFATTSALGSLGRLRAEAAMRGLLPADVNLGAQYPVKVVLSVIDHLTTCWSPVPPMRHHERRRVRSRMNVVGSLPEIRQHLAGQARDTEAAESWTVEDVSQGGIGAHVSLVGKEWLKVGSLVGLQPEGGDNWLVGVVRRFVRETDALGNVGIETLSKQPRGIVADSHGLRREIVMLDPPQEGAELRLALSADDWEEQAPLYADIDGRRFLLLPEDLLDTGVGHVVGSYRAEVSFA